MDSLEVYKKILLIRSVEQKLDDLFKRGLVHGTAHFCIGQEFIPVIISQYLRSGDSVTSNHRGHGHAISAGLEIKPFIAELLGKEKSYNGGKSGSQHVISPLHNFYANGITGGMVPIANGFAFYYLKEKKQNISVAYFGDGAMNEGYVLEALNLSEVMGLPVLFVCENNKYAMSTPTKNTHAVEPGKKAKALGIETFIVRDNNYHELDEVVKQIVPSMRKNSRPVFIEVKTYRHHGHSKNDQNFYRPKEEEAKWKALDVELKLRKEIISKNVISVKELNRITKETYNVVDSIAEEIVNWPDADDTMIQRHVYCERI